MSIKERVRNMLSATNWQRGRGYVNKTKKVDVYANENSLTFRGVIRGNSVYTTSITLPSGGGVIHFSCTCPAAMPSGGCKHIAALARANDRDYRVDENIVTATSKNTGQVTGWNLRTHTPSPTPSHSSSEAYDDPSNYTINPIFFSTFPSDLDPNDPTIIRMLLEDYPSLLVEKEKNSNNRRTDKKRGEDGSDTSPALSLLSLLSSEDEPQSAINERYYRIKLKWGKVRNEERNDLKLHFYEAKKLKNGNLSSGQEIYQGGNLPRVLTPLKHFLGTRYSYYSPPDSFSFADSPEAFIRLLETYDFPLTTLENEPILLKRGLVECRLEVKKGSGKKVYQIMLFFSHPDSGKIVIPVTSCMKIFLAPHTHIGGIITPERNLFFFRSPLPHDLIMGLSRRSLFLTQDEWQTFRNTSGFEPLLSYVKDLDFLGEGVTSVSPQIRITIDIDLDKDAVTVEPDYFYDFVRVHPKSEKKLLLQGEKIIKRDIGKEQEEYRRLEKFFEQCGDYDTEMGIYLKNIDDSIDDFFDGVESLISEGVNVEYRKATKRVSRKPLGAKISIDDGEDWFDMNVEFTLGDTRLDTGAEILRSLRKGGKYVTLESVTVVQIQDDITNTLSLWDEIGISEKNIDSTVKIGKYTLGLLKERAGIMGQFELKAEVLKLQKSLENFSGIKRHAIPQSARVMLRPYQQEGYNWLQFLKEYNFSGILADDMGLGKTIQTLVFLESLYAPHREKVRKKLPPTLIIVPTSLVLNWMDEAEKFTPDLKVSYIKDGKTGFSATEKQSEIIIVSYGFLVNCIEQKEFRERLWHVVILDEAQNIKNSKSERTKAVMKLQSTHRLALTGTPLENNLFELWSIFEFLMPGFLGYEGQFRERYVKGDATNLQNLSQKVRPFLLRRTKEKVLTELPEKNEEIIHLEMGKSQKNFYDTLKIAYRAQITQKITQEGLAKSQFAVLDALLKLRQASLMPLLIPGQTEVPESAKLQYLDENIEEMITAGHSVLIFSQFTGFLRYIRELLDTKSIRYQYLDGQTKREERKACVDCFNMGQVSVFLISLKAGGVGLNLIGADTVIHMDPWWNPAVENQATDRAHRIGQKKTVFVQKLIVRGTVEEKILKLQQKKKKLIDDLFSGDFHGRLTEEDVKFILK